MNDTTRLAMLIEMVKMYLRASEKETTEYDKNRIILTEITDRIADLNGKYSCQIENLLNRLQEYTNENITRNERCNVSALIEVKIMEIEETMQDE